MLISQDLSPFGKMDFWEALLKVEMLIFVMFFQSSWSWNAHRMLWTHYRRSLFRKSDIKKVLFKATLISITPKTLANGDRIITSEQFNKDIDKEFSEALLIRTLPNEKINVKRITPVQILPIWIFR